MMKRGEDDIDRNSPSSVDFKRGSFDSYRWALDREGAIVRYLRILKAASVPTYSVFVLRLRPSAGRLDHYLAQLQPSVKNHQASPRHAGFSLLFSRCCPQTDKRWNSYVYTFFGG